VGLVAVADDTPVERHPYLRTDAHLSSRSGRNETEAGTVRGYTMDKQACLDRLRQLKGQVRGLRRMIDQDATASTS
jgi:hypothetical protein